MNKKIWIFLLLCLALFALVACEEGVCHHPDKTETVHAPTCSLEGYVLNECRDCGYSYKSDFVEPTGHTLTETVVAPTCTEEGYTSYACECGYHYDTAFLAPLGHTYTSKITEATCTEEGYTTYTCGVCEYEFRAKRTVPNGHSLFAETVAATCTEEGYTLHKCANCNYSFKTDFITPAHTFTVEKHAPTIGTTGYVSHKCSVCEYAYNSDFVWYSDIFSGAEGEGNGVLARGIDISAYNKDVDFSALKKAGIDYVILRVGTGYSGKDELFEQYYTAAKAAGLGVGCYYYTYAYSVADALGDAERVKEYIKGKTFEYPIYFDLEDDSQKRLDKQLLMDMCYAFCNSMIEAGYFPGIYCNLNWAENILHTEQLVTLFDVWLARYNEYLPDAYYDDQFGMWQYTETGSIDGVTGKADLNYCYKNYPAIIQKYGFNGFDKEAES